MKDLGQKLIIPIVVGIIGLTGCAYNAKTNLAKNIKGLNVQTLTYPTERFHLNDRVEYVVDRTPKEFLLPSGTRITSDAIMRMDQVIGEEKACDNKVDFTPKEGYGYFAVAPINPTIKDSKRVLYLVDPKEDKKDILHLPPQFNIPKRNIKPGFGVEKVVTNPIKIEQTVYFPHIKNAYAIVGNFPVYENSSLEKLADSEPVLIISTDSRKTSEIVDYTNNQRGIKGALKVLVRLPLAPKITPKISESTLEIPKEPQTISPADIVITKEPIKPVYNKTPELKKN